MTIKSMQAVHASIIDTPRAPCLRCSAGPSQINGHDDLRATTLGSGSMGFECRACGTRWSRVDKAAGAFEWKLFDRTAPFDRTRTNGIPLP
jgi:hypothetical protein